MDFPPLAATAPKSLFGPAAENPIESKVGLFLARRHAEVTMNPQKFPLDNRRKAIVEGDELSRTETTPTTDPTSGYDAAGRAFEMLLNVLFARVPMVVIVLRHTTTISANITAYSTAVGPSSDFRKRCTFKARFFIVPTPLFVSAPASNGSVTKPQ